MDTQYLTPNIYLNFGEKYLTNYKSHLTTIDFTEKVKLKVILFWTLSTQKDLIKKNVPKNLFKFKTLFIFKRALTIIILTAKLFKIKR